MPDAHMAAIQRKSILFFLLLYYFISAWSKWFTNIFYAHEHFRCNILECYEMSVIVFLYVHCWMLKLVLITYQVRQIAVENEWHTDNFYLNVPNHLSVKRNTHNTFKHPYKMHHSPNTVLCCKSDSVNRFKVLGRKLSLRI